MEWVGFDYAVLVFCCAVAVWCFYLFVELCVGFCGGFCCFWVGEVEEAFFEYVWYVLAFDGFDGLHFAVEDFHGFGEFFAYGVCCVYVGVACYAYDEDAVVCFADG